MAAPIDIDIELSDQARAVLDRAVAAAADLSAPMQDIAGHLASEARLRFETGTDPAGVPWKPSRRVKENPGEKTLVLSGDLSNSIAEDWGPDYAAAGPEASGGAAVYAAIHQLGGTIVPRHKQALSFGGRIVSKVVIPARAYLGWNQGSEDYAVGTLVDFLSRIFGGADGESPAA